MFTWIDYISLTPIPRLLTLDVKHQPA